MPRKKNQIINLTIVLATSSIYIRSSPYKRSRSKLRVLYKFNKFSSDRVDVKSTTTHVRYIINLFTHSFFIYTKKKNSSKRWDIWQKDRILWVWSLPTTVSSTSNAENSVFEWKCVCVCLNTCCDQEIKGRRPLLLLLVVVFFSLGGKLLILHAIIQYSHPWSFLIF